jgi:hypothetical protein
MEACKQCGTEIPDWLSQLYKGRCANCHIGHVCLYCKKPKVPIGDARNGGKPGRRDWDERNYHVKCWKYLKKIGQIK